MRRAITFASLVLVAGLLQVGGADAAPPDKFSPGAKGVGDPYFPLDGNGGYDVEHYALELRFDPATGELEGIATITAAATQNLSRFNFDFDGLTVRSITVDGNPAKWNRARGELTVRPQAGILDGTEFEVVVEYDGVPEALVEFGGTSGFMQTEDGVMVLGQPHVASTWFPANDHPIDKASFSFSITAPQDLEVVANGILEGTTTAGGLTTWDWEATDPMATYLASMAIGEFDVRQYQIGSLPVWDAIDSTTLEPSGTPRTGTRFALSQSANSSYKRLTRTIDVPAGGATVSFWVDRSTEEFWDFFFVEAHTPGQDDWTTLPDLNGHSTQITPLGFVPEEHPFLLHYLTCDVVFEPCDPEGTTGEWWASSGFSDGYEEWTVDLSAWSGGAVELSFALETDVSLPFHGVFVDDVEASTGEGSTSFEDDGNPLDGWAVTGPPATSPGNDNDWIVGSTGDAPANFGVVAEQSFERQGDIIAFEEGLFGPYPFQATGGVLDEGPFQFALEVQTRPVYATAFFNDPNEPDDSVVVHELAHQWVGDSLAVERWSEIWLNEGFATYTEWLWSEHEGLGTAQEIFDGTYDGIPAEDPFWSVVIGDPGPESMFDFAVYARGAMTLHQLRLAVGDADFFEILQTWTTSNAGGHVTTDDFIALAEDVSGQQLDDLFETWLFTDTKPVLEQTSLQAQTATGGGRGSTMFYANLVRQLEARQR
jgi:peptidase M1-like protein/immune inhibitor InhA-like protein